MTERKTEFYWASIAGADPEPVELATVDGRQAVYTCGCADPFFLDSDPVALGAARYMPGDSSSTRLDLRKPIEPLERPLLANKEEAAEIARHYHPPTKVAHGWRGPR